MLRTAFLFLACVVVGTYAAGSEVRAHPLTNLPPAGEISTGFFFPDFPTKQFPAGELVKIDLGIHNDGSESYNISAIMGSLNSPQDFKVFFYNFTQQVYFEVVEPGQELSVEYEFALLKDLPPRDYQVALTVFYEAKDGFKATTFFNQTIEVVDVKKLIDTDLIFLYLLLLGILAFVGYITYQYVQPYVKVLPFSKKSRKVEATPTARDDDDWVKGTNYANFQKKKSLQKSNSKNKSS